jgi:hypothetical protein
MGFSLDKAMAALRSQMKNIESEDLEKILAKVSIPGPRGEKGDPGSPGKDAVVPKVRDGIDGKDAPIPEFVVTACTQGDAAAVQLKRDKNGAHVFSFTLPRGKQGEVGAASQIPGPRGLAGRDGVSPEPPPPQFIETSVRKTLEAMIAANPEKFRGPVGPAGEYVVGPKGDPGMTRAEIIQVLIETLQTSGVLTESQEKLLRIRAKLRAAINEADSRSQHTIGKIVKDVDKLFDSDPEADAKRREQALRNENEALRKQLEEKKS